MTRTPFPLAQQQWQVSFLVEDYCIFYLHNTSSPEFGWYFQCLNRTSAGHRPWEWLVDQLRRGCEVSSLLDHPNTRPNDATYYPLLEAIEEKFVLFSGYFWQIFPVTEGGSHAHIKHACVKMSLLFLEFRTLRVTSNMWLTAQRKYRGANTDALSYLDFLIDLCEGCVTTEEKHHDTLLPWISWKSGFRRFGGTIFYCFETKDMVDDWPARHAILTEKIQSLKNSPKLLERKQQANFGRLQAQKLW